MEQNNLFNVAEVEISYRPNYRPSERPQISTSQQAYEILIAHWSLNRLDFLEEFKIILLNRRNKVLGLAEISTGGVSGTLADPKVIFAIALKSGASGVILCHNHPSQELEPSKEDQALTQKLKQGGNLLDISILDHLIISKDSFYSLADEGVI